MNRQRRRAAGVTAIVLAAVLLGCGAPMADAPTPTGSPRGAPSLAATLPRQLDGTEVPIYSMRGPEFVASADADPELLEFLARLDAEMEDVSVAFGFATEPPVDLIALRVEGVAEQRLSREFRAAHEDGDASPMRWESATVGDKRVMVADAGDAGGQRLYLYVRGDTLYLVATPEPRIAEEALASLP